MNKITTIGLDIAKNSFSVHGFDSEDQTVVAKELKRPQVLAFFSKLASSDLPPIAFASAAP